MVGIIFLIVFIVLGGTDLLRSGIRDLGSQARSRTSFSPTWIDSHGNERLKTNNKKVISEINSEGHYIVIDKKGKRTDLTFENNIKPYITQIPGLVLQYGNDMHIKDDIPGARYIEYYQGKYVFYTVAQYKSMQYYIDPNNGQAVKPTQYTIKKEQRAEELGLKYYSYREIMSIMDELNRIPLWKRKSIWGFCYCFTAAHADINTIDKHLREEMQLKLRED